MEGSSTQTSKMIATNNLRVAKKQLKETKKFIKLDEYVGKANFSRAYKMYGSFETWDIALNTLNNLPSNENVFNELILSHNKVKPYLDVEWYKNNFPEYDPDAVKLYIKTSIVKLFDTDYNIKLNTNDILFAKCHREKNDGYKYSFHIVISTHPSLVFINNNQASSLAKNLRKLFESESIYDKSVIDLAVYNKTQNFRLLGHCKLGENKPLTTDPIDLDINPLEYLVSNVDNNSILIKSNEQDDTLYKTIKNINTVDSITDEQTECVIKKVQLVHPTAALISIDERGFMQFNYKDRKEQCFSNDKVNVFHDQIGFFAYIYNNLICLGCHSGNCVDSENKKIIKILGSLEVTREQQFEKVDLSNEFSICHAFTRNCIFDGAVGISNLFKEMYLSPKRIKWINNTKTGTTYYWNGKIWEEDDFAFIDKLLAVTVVKVLRAFHNDYVENKEIINEESDTLIAKTQMLIMKINDGVAINNILRFIKSDIRDIHFTKEKDIHPYWLSCNNGMVDLITGNLRLAVPEDNITKALKTDYNPEADSEDFDKFIREITSDLKGPNEDLYNFLRWLIGYSIQGSPRRKLFIILYGPWGFNGKSLCVNTIKNVLEYNAVAMDSSVVLDNGTKKTGGSHSTEIMQLEYARLGILSDTKEDSVINDGMIKMLTGITDTLSGREIFGKQKEITPKFVPWISTNNPVQLNLSDKSMYDRLVLFPFDLSFVSHIPTKPYERPGDSSLDDKFKLNKEGTLKWIVDCSIYYNQNKDMQIPEVINEAKRRYNKQVNTYVDFADNTVTITKSASDRIKKIDIINMYKTYLQENSIKKKSTNTSIEREFDKIFKVATIKSMKYYIYVKFKNEEESDSEEDELS